MRKVLAAIGILNLGLVSTVVGEDTSSLVEQLDSWSKNKAKRASDKLAAMGAKAVPELIEALNGKHRRQRRFAARTLRQIGQEAAEAIPALSKSLEDSDALTREYSVEALGKMADQADEVMPALTRATEDDEPRVREQARLAIIRLAKSGKTQRPAGPTQARPTTNYIPGATGRIGGTGDPMAGNSASSLSEQPSQRGGYSGEQILAALLRCGLLTCVVVGFFVLLHVYRESAH